MKLGVEASCIARKQRTGVDTYTFKLLENIAQLDPSLQIDLAYFRFFTKPPVDLGVAGPNVHQKRVGLIPIRVYNVLFKYLIAPPIDLISGARGDIFLFPNFGRWPLLFRSRSIVVIHDLAYLNAPQFVPPRLRNYLLKFVPKAINSSKLVFAVSETTKRDIIEAYHVDPAKVVVVSNAVDHSYFYPREDALVDEAKLRYGINKPYVMFHGTVEPRKNIEGLLRAFLALPQPLSEDYCLVITGGKGWLDEEIINLIQNVRDGGNEVIQTGYLPQADLPILLSGAKVFVYPSFFEGFGLPILEAMACGAPVITSNVSSLPEAAGDAGLLVDPTDHQAIAAAISKVLTDTVLANKMRTRGMAHAQTFDWAFSAQRALTAFHDLADSK